MPFKRVLAIAIWLNSLAACLHSMGSEMPRVHDVVPLLDVDGVVEALTAGLQSTLSGSGSLYCPHAALTQGVVSHAHAGSGLNLIALDNCSCHLCRLICRQQ